MEIPTLHCNFCDEDKYLIFFNKSRRLTDGKTGTCQQCVKSKAKKSELQTITDNCPLVPLGKCTVCRSLVKRKRKW